MHIRHLFDQHAKPGIFVGYPFRQKGYHIYDFHSRHIYVSRDVMFCKTQENFIFSEKWKNGNFIGIVQAKTCKFSRYQMTKQTLPLESSREI